ncbi:hypothetical protein SAMN05414139_06008 [Burkholderia sp. D7]|nr:hypothetical protein SAMN05414139_06008 [Burkholderia sp. D7]
MRIKSGMTTLGATRGDSSRKLLALSGDVTNLQYSYPIQYPACGVSDTRVGVSLGCLLQVVIEVSLKACKVC